MSVPTAGFWTNIFNLSSHLTSRSHCVYSSERICLFSFQKTSGGGRDSTGLPFPFRPKLKPERPPAWIKTSSLPAFPTLTWLLPPPHTLPHPDLFYLRLRHSSLPKPSCKPQLIVLKTEAPLCYTRGPPEVPLLLHILTPQTTKMATCKLQGGCTALVTKLHQTVLCWQSSFVSRVLRSKQEGQYLTFPEASLCKHLTNCLWRRSANSPYLWKLRPYLCLTWWKGTPPIGHALSCTPGSVVLVHEPVTWSIYFQYI